MITAKLLWGNVLLGGKLQIGAKNSNFEIFESALNMKSVSMPLTIKWGIYQVLMEGTSIQMVRSRIRTHYAFTCTLMTDSYPHILQTVMNTIWRAIFQKHRYLQSTPVWMEAFYILKYTKIVCSPHITQKQFAFTLKSFVSCL